MINCGHGVRPSAFLAGSCGYVIGFLSVLLLATPSLVFGHACEFLVARLELTEGVVSLEITADYGANPLIADEAAARKAVKNILQVRSGGQTRSLETLAPLRLERSHQWDPAAPTAFAPPPEGEQHLLIQGKWSWKADAEEISFCVPNGNLHDVLLWTVHQPLRGTETKWLMLIEGEETPPLRVIKAQPSRSLAWTALGSLPLTVLLILGWRWRAQKRIC